MFFGLSEKMTEEQKEYLASIYANQLTIVDARAGTGKTTLAVAAAKTMGKPLVYIIPPIQQNTQGFIPGPPSQKDAPYLRPLRDALIEINEEPDKVIMNPEENPMAIKNGTAWVDACSYTYWRGGNLKNCTVIIDECQNWTLPWLKMVLTRCHDSAKAIVIGHNGQCDLKDPSQSGFPTLIKHFADKPYAKVCTLTYNFRGTLANDADEMR